MIRQYNKIMTRVSLFLNNIGSIILFLIMLLVIANVLLRLIGKPIQSTFELVGLLTSVVIGFTLAFCAVKDAHISISILIQRFSVKSQKVVDIFINFISIVFLAFVTFQMFKYASLMSERGEIAVTAGIKIAPFIYMITVGSGVYAFVQVGKFLSLFAKDGDD